MKILMQTELICPECKTILIFDKDKHICPSGHQYFINDKAYNLLPKTVSNLILDDAKYHGKQKDQWINQHQINSPRSFYFHNRIVNYIVQNSNDQSSILELGGGVGFDLDLFLRKRPLFKRYIFSEISMDLLSWVKQKYHNDRIGFFCVDAHSLPFRNNQFDFICMTATAHHFQSFNNAFEEIIRVTKPDGTIILGIEPNVWLMKLVNGLKKNHLLDSRLFEKENSPADQVAIGMTINDYMAVARLYNLEIIKLEAVWFLTGFLHYGLEIIYRLFRLKKRIILPKLVEQIFIHTDNCLARLPVFRDLFFNYTVIFKKRRLFDAGVKYLG